MAAKKAAKKGDEPVRMGRAKAQRTKGILKDPYGYTSGKNMNKAVAEEVANRMRVGKQKYGTNYVVEVSMDGVVRTKAGASAKAKKAESSRMTAQAVSAQTTAAQKKASSGKQTDLAGTAGYGKAIKPSAQSGFTGNYFGNIGRTAQRGKDQARRAAAKKKK